MKKDTLKRSISALLTVVMMGAGFAGCGKENSKETKPLLEGTVLENGFVVYVDEEPILMTFEALRDNGKKFANGCSLYHYRDIIAGNYYHVADSEYRQGEYCEFSRDDGVIILPEDTKVKALANVLTEEEMSKAIEGKFTDADVLKLQTRLTKEAKQ